MFYQKEKSNNAPYNPLNIKGYLWKKTSSNSGDINQAISAYFAEPKWLLHRLIFVTIYLYARNKPISREKLLKGVGYPYLSKVSGILGDWENKGFLVKSKIGKELFFQFDGAVYDSTWQSHDLKKTNAFRYKMEYVNFNLNGALSARERAKNNARK